MTLPGDVASNWMIKKPRRKSIFFIIVVCVLSGLCLLASLAIAYPHLVQTLSEQVQVENVVYDFMQAKKVDSEVGPSYQSIVITGTEIYETIAVYDAVSPAPYRAPEHGMVAHVNGLVVYEDKRTGNFEASLEKKDGIWQLTSIDIGNPLTKSSQ